ncbi:hypothetical protein M1105_03340 [Limibaculum sp. FT325]|uniref:hypothetical protein n=1 Tax=Thermohalobaculum sediminis TaxID=2939436 RepID=UPI0020BED95F|nr:hypothetical protein [Limibaculum sediminis]MCL5776034.1 hypothetical protein [Limibaculum sediminis]
MKHLLFRSIATAALAAGLLAGPGAAAAQNTLEQRLTVDAAAERAAQEREIVSIVEAAFGRTAVVNTGTGLAPEIDDQIYPGNTLPANAPVRPVPEQIAGKLPQITPGARWVGVGRHLVELGPSDRIEVVIYHSLP